jgi:UDP-N-acetylglucosamine acyltransferase
MGEATVVGSNNFLMANSHVGHNTVVGNHVILVNGALLAGHVEVGDRAFISGNCLVHQFCRVGTLSIMRGGSAISQDLPPFTVVREDNRMSGLNAIGLRRAGMTTEQRLELKKLYHTLFRSMESSAAALALARKEFISETARVMIDFVASAKRGVCRDIGVKSRRAGKIDEGDID